MEPLEIVFQLIWDFLKTTWWFFALFILFPMFRSSWLFWRQELFKNENEWAILELKMPREIKKGVQAMEQVLTALNSLRNFPATVKDKYIAGEMTRPFSLEIVSLGGEVRFFVRAYAKHRGMVEAAFFSYYPDVEVFEVDDYMNQLPANLQEVEERNLSILGTEIVLSKESAYPIKTYRSFESPAEEKEFDPMSTFVELLSKVKKGEFVGIQILIAPSVVNWSEKYKDVVGKLKESSTKGVPKIAPPGTVDFTKLVRTPGETHVLEEVENNLSKLAFDTIVRLLYLSPKDVFFGEFVRRGLVGAFNQYAALNLNSFRPNYAASTMIRPPVWPWQYIFAKKRVLVRKRRFLYEYRRREMPPQTFMGRVITSHFFNWNFASNTFQLNTEGVATIFHPPTYFVLTTPHLKRVESRKAGPPAGLAIFGEEEEIEKFK